MADTRPLRGSRNRNRRGISLGREGGGQGGGRAVRHVSQDYCAGVLSYCIFCMGTNVFLTFFLKEKKTTSTLRTLLCLKLVEIGPLSTLIFVLCQRVPTKK